MTNLDQNWPIINTVLNRDASRTSTAAQVDSTVSKMTNLNIYNVKDTAYGATGNGITNDTTAIQAAIDTAGSAGGGIVYFPAGIYNFTTLALNQNYVSLYGAGVGACALRQTSGVNGVTISANANGLSDLNIVGPGSGSSGTLLYLLNNSTTRINKIYISGKDAGIGVEATVTPQTSCDTIIQDFTIDTCVTGLKIGHLSTTAQYPQGVIVHNGKIGACTNGIYIKGCSDVDFGNVSALNCTSTGIVISPDSGMKSLICILLMSNRIQMQQPVF